MKQRTFPIFALTLVLFVACSKTPDKIVSINPYDLTIEHQVTIGAAFQLALESHSGSFPILSETAYPVANAYLKNLFFTMLNTAPVQRRLDFDWSTHILQDDSIRTAFFLPGGHFYIYTGLLKYLESEAELLGVIGHELYYVDSDLLIERMRQEFTGEVLGDILLGNPVPELEKYAEEVPKLTFGEDKVTEADSFAVQLICPFLYEASGIEKILEKAAQEDVLPLWLQTRQGKFVTRLLLLGQETAQCGLLGVSNEESYLKFRQEYLP